MRQWLEWVHHLYAPMRDVPPTAGERVWSGVLAGGVVLAIVVACLLWHHVRDD